MNGKSGEGAAELELLIVGAGPYGLSAAALAKDRGVNFEIVGQPMQFWRENMPPGMFLRSSADWHMDPLEIHTFRRFLEERGMTGAECDPIPLQLYLDYAEWFREAKGIEPIKARVENLSRAGDGLFMAHLDNGDNIVARNVLCAPGVGYFPVLPEQFNEVSSIYPDFVMHTSGIRTLDLFSGKRCVIVGGRQSAFEYAALLGEAGAAEVHVVFRHAAPSFEPSQWEWVDEMMNACEKTSSWYRSLPQAEREQIVARFWGEGRLKLEPWLTPRLDAANVQVHENQKIANVQQVNGGIEVQLESGERIGCDRIILATGYKVDISRVPYLDQEALVANVKTQDGFPVLSPTFESSIPGLYFTGLCAARDFGPFFGFVRACNVSAKTIIGTIAESPAVRSSGKTK